jgi:small subunit ribosomal protein S6
VLRHLTVAMDKAETNPSIMMKHVEREEARKTSSSPSSSSQPQEAAA